MAKIIIVDSVKGGCGKTTMAVATAIRSAKILPKRNPNEHNKEDPNVCIIDMDLLGTSMERMLCGDKFIKNNRTDLEKSEILVKSGILEKASYYLNDLADGTASFDDNYITTVEMHLNDGRCLVDFVVSSPEEKDRRKFKISGNSNYTMQITPTHFRGVIKKLVKRLLNDDHETIIFDMPPNSDMYTDCVFDLFLDQNGRDQKIEKVELKIISTYDASHVYANTDRLVSLLEGSDHHWRSFDSIKFVFNNSTIDETILETDYPNIKSDAKSYIKSRLPLTTEPKELRFYHMSYNINMVKHSIFKSDIKFCDFGDFQQSWYKENEIFDVHNDQ